MPHFLSGINSPVLSANLIPLTLSLSLTCLISSYHIFSLCQLTTLTINNSLSLTSGSKPTSFVKIFPIIDSLWPQGWLHGLYDWTVSSEHLGLVFSFYPITLFSVHVRYVLLPSVCRVSVVRNARAPYSAGWNFRQCFYAIWYLGHPLTST